MKTTMLPSGILVGTLIVAGTLLLRPAADTAAISGSQQGSDGSTQAKAAVVPASTSVPRVADAIALDPVTPPQEPAKDECAFWQGTVDRMGLSVQQWASASTAVVRGTVEEIGDAQWNTPDGKAPIDQPAAYWDVMRLIRLAPVDTLKGQLSSTTAWVPGGTIGCLTFVVEGYDVEVGQESLFFMRDIDPDTGLQGTSRARLIWPIREDGTVSTPIDGRLSVVEIAERIAGS